MAHGSPRIDICHDCKQYIWVARFSSDPNCPDCNKASEQTTKEAIKTKYNLSILHDFSFSFNNWTKI